VLGVDQFGPDPRLPEEARRRGVAWLFGTEGGEPGSRYMAYNLVRGEDNGAPSFVQAKTIPMPFGERMPGPDWMRAWLDEKLGFISQVPGRLTAQSGFRMETPQGPLVVHPLICSEALIATRVQEGVALTGAELLTNHTNDGWFDRSVATDLHGVQIRLRAAEMGLPMLRTTLTGKSGVFRRTAPGPSGAPRSRRRSTSSPCAGGPSGRPRAVPCCAMPLSRCSPWAPCFP